MRKYFYLILALLSFSGCLGTETGNPAYTNTSQGITTQYPSNWSITEVAASNNPTAMPGDPAPMEEPSIPASTSPSTRFSDGQSTVTIYYVTVASGTDLLTYLQTIFPSRAFTSYSNGAINGYFYNDTALGTTGGDLIEYYFLEDTKLIYVVTDLFPAAASNYFTIIQSLRF